MLLSRRLLYPLRFYRSFDGVFTKLWLTGSWHELSMSSSCGSFGVGYSWLFLCFFGCFFEAVSGAGSV